MVLVKQDRVSTINKKLRYEFKPIIESAIDNTTPAEKIVPQLVRYPKMFKRIPKMKGTRTPKILKRVPKLISSEELVEDLKQITSFVECTVRKQLSFVLKYNYFCSIDDYVSEAKQHVVKRFLQGKFKPPQLIYKKDENGNDIVDELGRKRVDSRPWARMVATNKIKHIRAFWSAKKRSGGLGRTFFTSDLHNVLSDQSFDEHVEIQNTPSNREPTVQTSFHTKNRSENFSGISSRSIEKLEFYKNDFKILDSVKTNFSGDMGLKIWTTLIEQPKEYIEFIYQQIEDQESKYRRGEIKRVITKCIDPLNLKWIGEFLGIGNKAAVKKILKRFLTESGLYAEWNVAGLLGIS